MPPALILRPVAAAVPIALAVITDRPVPRLRVLVLAPVPPGIIVMPVQPARPKIIVPLVIIVLPLVVARRPVPPVIIVSLILAALLLVLVANMARLQV